MPKNFLIICKNGCLLDGTSIHDAIEKIDNATKRKPLAYMSNCVHHKVMYEALGQKENQTALVGERYVGIQATSSSLSPEELNEDPELKEDDFSELIEYMMLLNRDYKFKIFGGCCGTNEKHIEVIAKGIREIRY